MGDKFFKAEIIADFRGGKNTVLETDVIDVTQARECINVNLFRKLGVRPREGATIDGTVSTTTNPITNAHTFTRKDGLERPLRSSGTILEYRNPFVATIDYFTLDTGFTSGKIFGFADGDTLCYMGNGVEVIRRWTGACARFDQPNSTANIIALKTETENGVTLNTAALLGFSSSGTVLIAGTAYTYSGLSALTLTGVGSDPTSETDLDPVVEKPITSGFTSAPLGNIFLIKDSQLIIAGDPSNINTVYGSKIANVLSFDFSTPALADDGFAIKFWGKPITSLGDKGEYIATMKEDSAKAIRFTKLVSTSDTILTVPKLDSIFKGNGLGAINHKGTEQLDYDFLFSSRQVGIRRISRAQTAVVDKPNSMTEAIEDDYQNYDQSDVCMGVFRQQIHQGLRSNSDLSGNNLVILKDQRTGFIGTYSGINASCFYIFNNKLFFGDAFTKNSWQLYNGEYADFDGTNYFDYIFRWKSKFFDYDFPEHLKELGYIWLEGFILPNTQATFTINFETPTGVTSVDIPINGTDDYVHPQPINALGANPLTQTTLAGSEDLSLPPGSRRFFRMINSEKFGFRGNQSLKLQYQIQHNNAGDFIHLTKIRPFIKVLPITASKNNRVLNSLST